MFRWSEYCVGIIFIIMILLWITREFDETPGWGTIFQHEYEIIEPNIAIVFCT